MAKKVLFDYGHGGRDPGAVGISGLKEKDVVLSLQPRLERLFKQNKAVLAGHTRWEGEDHYLSLKERAEWANALGVDLFVSIHCNAASNRLAAGVETFHYRYSKRSAKAAAVFQKQLVKTYPKWSLRDRGVKRANFYVLRETNMRAVLLEIGFITNPFDASLFQTSEWLDKVAESIYEATLEVLEVDLSEAAPTESTEPSVQPSWWRRAVGRWSRWLSSCCRPFIAETH